MYIDVGMCASSLTNGMCDHGSLDIPTLDVDFEDPCFLCYIFLFLL